MLHPVSEGRGAVELVSYAFFLCIPPGPCPRLQTVWNRAVGTREMWEDPYSQTLASMWLNGCQTADTVLWFELKMQCFSLKRRLYVITALAAVLARPRCADCAHTVRVSWLRPPHRPNNLTSPLCVPTPGSSGRKARRLA